MNIDNRALVITRAGRTYRGSAIVAALAANYSAVGIECYAASTRLVVVKRIAVSLSVAAGTVDIYDAADDFSTGTVITPLYKRQGISNASAYGGVRWAQNPALNNLFTAGAVSSCGVTRAGAANAAIELITDSPIILEPDSGLFITATAQNVGVSVVFEWEELGG